MTIVGRSISPGKGRGEAIVLNEPLSFLGGVEGSTGELKVADGGNVAGKVLVFPKGKGSTVGSFVMYDLMVHGKQPAAVINESAETIVATGAVISSIPMVDGIQSVSLFRTGDIVEVDGDTGSVEITGVRVRRAVTSAIVRDGKVLLLKRPDTERSFPGKWSMVSGSIEDGESPEEAAVREIREETSMEPGPVAATAEQILVREGDVIWELHPFLFRLSSGDVKLNPENVGYEWVPVGDVGGYDTVDGMDLVLGSLDLC
ncbi:MAG: DUF126 domain-containing protein [Candidatus Methanomethylophilaceae archaeon]|nr:DUF126 domain-containing protein [Candidatus Methanomethylophilaceae archaeon]